MQGKTVSETRLVSAIHMNPQDANPSGNVQAGIIMLHVDTTASIVAARHSRNNVVTASMDRLNFFHPVYIGDLLILKASVNQVGNSSMEVGVRVEAENTTTGEKRHTASAYLSLVALDEKGRPTEVPPLILETDEEKRRHLQAQQRRKMRLVEKVREAEDRK
jgi:acyl-CoA hydrolase